MGGISCSLELESGGFPPEVWERYKDHAVDDADYRLSLSVERAMRPGGFWPKVSKRGERLSARSSPFDWEIDLKDRVGRARMAPGAQALDSLWRTVFATLAPVHDCLILHGAAAAHKGEGFLFLGSSGAGKTTLAKRLSGALGTTVLTDELALIRRTSRGISVCATPFWGEFRLPGGPGEAPLKTVVFLSKSSGAPKLRRLGPAESQPKALKCLVAFHKDKELIEKSWTLLLVALSLRSAWELSWNGSEPAESLWRCLEGI